jgi:DeoR family suf operon transcriptional repressor
MKNNRWLNRLLAGTRGQLLTELRRGPATINDLVSRLALSANAVRSHLAALERDGLVEQNRVQRQGVGKPAHIYRLAPEASSLSPKAYDLMLGLVLDAAEDRSGPKGYAALLKEVAQRLAGDVDSERLSFEKRLEGAKALLASVGANVEIQRVGKKVRLVGSDCPLSSLVVAHTELCGVFADVIARRLGVTVTECCDRNSALPRCCFEAVVSRIA